MIFGRVEDLTAARATKTFVEGGYVRKQVGKTLQRKQEMSIVPGAGSPVLFEA